MVPVRVLVFSPSRCGLHLGLSRAASSRTHTSAPAAGCSLECPLASATTNTSTSNWWDGWFRRLRLCCTPWAEPACCRWQGLALGGASPLKIFGLLEVFHCPVVYGWNGLVLAAFVTLLPGIPARCLCCVLRRLNYVNSFWRTSAGSALASARCFCGSALRAAE